MKRPTWLLARDTADPKMDIRQRAKIAISLDPDDVTRGAWHDIVKGLLARIDEMEDAAWEEAMGDDA